MINLIAALNNNDVIGNEGKIPWHIPEDLQFFKKVTMGHTVIMGRKTWHSITNGLPGRRVLVLSRNENYMPPDAIRCDSLEEAILFHHMNLHGDIFIAGGSEVYGEALKRIRENGKLDIDRMYITFVNDDSEGDTILPSPVSNLQDWNISGQDFFREDGSLWYSRATLTQKE